MQNHAAFFASLVWVWCGQSLIPSQFLTNTYFITWCHLGCIVYQNRCVLGCGQRWLQWETPHGTSSIPKSFIPIAQWTRGDLWFFKIFAFASASLTDTICTPPCRNYLYLQSFKIFFSLKNSFFEQYSWVKWVISISWNKKYWSRKFSKT